MPGYFHQPISRKRFLRTSAAFISSGFAMSRTGSAAAEAGGEGSAARVALLSDTHIQTTAGESYRGFDPIANLRQIVPDVVASQPAAVIINGDAARLEGLTTDYQQLKQLLTPIAAVAPTYVGLGNHDDRDNFFLSFPQDDDGLVEGKHIGVFEQDGVRFVVLDSLMYVNKVPGFLGKSQRVWLGNYLQRNDQRPVMVFVHHTLGDGDGDLLDVDRLFDVLLPHQQVKAVFYGHSHEYKFTNRGHIHLINLPAVGYNFNDNEPVGWVDAEFSAAAARFTLRTIAGNQSGNGQTTVIRW